jgi:RNA polymerase sigma-70 factor, ECF subfamily
LTREEEKSLVERVLRHDSDATVLFYDQYKRLIYGTIRKWTFIQNHEVDDVFQEFFTRLMESNWRRLSAWQGNSALSTYLVSILVNYLRDQYRKSRPMEDEGAIDEISENPREDIENNLHHESLRGYLIKSLQNLPERDSEIINQTFFKDRSADEVAASLGITTEAYYVALHRAKERLTKDLKEQFPYLFEDVV